MNKRRIFSIVLFCFFGALIINGVSAVQPYQHVTYGDAMASFVSNGAQGIELRGQGFEIMLSDWKLPAPITTGERIYPWITWFDQVQCEHDAFFISVGFSFWKSDMEYYGMTMDDFRQLREGFEFEFYIDEVQLETAKNPLHPGLFMELVYEDPYYLPDIDEWIPAGYVDEMICWWNQGTVFKAGELDVGSYELHTELVLFGFILVMEWTITFEIAECWH